jgi:hypothetical protein
MGGGERVQCMLTGGVIQGEGNECAHCTFFKVVWKFEIFQNRSLRMCQEREIKLLEIQHSIHREWNIP